ncbi:TonB-dependent receptor plug domain-containing protein [Horticoccus sp. 23ND18S-11]|uniref:TonB-dependent receptor plug domain-containing protein n=1 Tax=Horticoccus sp. 23ND18S-11 TaxID=3391832 RepID=UPI0039C8F7BA
MNPFTASSRVYLAAACLIANALRVAAQTPAPTVPAQLDPYVTTATRTAADPKTVGSVVDVLSAAEMARRQVTTLNGALGGNAGTPLFASGAMGATTSLFLRGANSNQTLFLVDGLRLNDPNTDYAVFLGGSCVSACDSLEIAHGPQSTLYGGEAIGGVVSLRAERGSGPAGGRTSFEAGSFGTVQGALHAQGERGATAWNFSGQGGHTDNERDNNAFDSANVTLRLDRTVSERIAIGGTLRWFHGVYGDPGDRYTNDPDNQSRESNLLTTAFATVTLAPDWSAHVLLGGQDRRFVSENPRAGRATQVTVVKNRRGVLDAQTSYRGVERHRLTAGLTAEANHTRNTGFGDINRKQTLLALFAQDEMTLAHGVALTAGLRNDDFDTFGRATTGRATAAWLTANRALKLRSSYGTAFRSPSFLDLYGQSAFYVGNPNLRPERARGWDAGADYYFAQRRGTLSATWFETDFTNLIASTPSFRSVENIQRARTRGAEVSATASLRPALELRANYTYLEAQNLTAGTRLLRRPRHRVGADLRHDFGRGVTGGIGASFVAQREDVHARTFRTVDGEDYSVVRVYGAWRIAPRLTLKARLENLLDESFEEVNGYPALGRGGFAGVEWSF